MKKEQIQLGLFSSADDFVCTDDMGLFVAMSQELGKPIFLPDLGLWIDAIGPNNPGAWVQGTGSEMGLDDGDIEVFGAGDANAWLIVGIMQESFPASIGMCCMDKVFMAQKVGQATLRMTVGGFNGHPDVESFWNWSVDGWTQIERS